MDFNGKAVLVYLEEDNITKAYFRIKPLLSEDGPITSEMLASLPDEGYLRIVPDRNEQHTFKERMRSMCGLCLLDLRNQPPEANKIRTNKNYNPANGENNQFIVYSDAVCAMEENLLFQVVAQSEAEKAVTPFVYIRSGANMQGPVKKDEPSIPQEARQLPPDSQELYSISVNGQELLFFWPRKAENKENTPPTAQQANTNEESEAAEAPVSALDQIQQINKQCVVQTGNLLSAKSSAEIYQKPAAPQQPLSGTRLYTPGQKNASFRRAHNPLMETVEFQRYASKQEAPGAVVNDSTALKDVPNPVDAFKRSLQHVCFNADDCRQAVDIILSCPGMKQGLFAAMTCENKNLVISAMQSQLQELEAERLMLLMQLDDAKKDMAGLKKQVQNELAADERSSLENIRKEQQHLESVITSHQNTVAAINELLSQAGDTLEKTANDENTALLIRMNGKKTEKEELIRRLENALKAAGFVCNEGDALALLTAYALSPDVLYISAAGNSDAAYAARVFAGIFGAPISLNQNENKILLVPGGNTPAFVRALPRKDCTTVILRGDDLLNTPCLSEYPFAMLSFAADLQAIPQDVAPDAPVCKCSVNTFVSDSKLNDDTLAAIQSLRCLVPAAPLPLSSVKNALRFIASTQNAFKGGVAEAIDRAVSMFVLPHYLLSGIGKDVLANQLSFMPRSLEIWNQVK